MVWLGGGMGGGGVSNRLAVYTKTNRFNILRVQSFQDLLPKWGQNFPNLPGRLTVYINEGQTVRLGRANVSFSTTKGGLALRPPHLV